MNLFDLFAKLSLDSSEYEEGLSDAEKKASTIGEKIGSGMRTLGKVAGAGIVAVGAATAATTKYLLDGAAKTAEYGDQIDKMSQKMGISAEAYQEWDAILQHSGSSIDSMQRGMMTLAQQAENDAEAFEALGLTQEQVASMSREELFAATIEGLQGMEEGTERAVLSQKLLGSAAKELGPLLNTSAEDTEAMRQAVHDLGGVMSDEAVKAAAAYQDSLQDMQTAFQGLQRGLFTEFMPGITQVMDGLSAIFSGDSESGIKMISDGVENVVNTISDKLPEFLDLGIGIVESLINALINNLPKLLESGGRLVGELVAGLIRAIPMIVRSIPQIISAIIQGLSAAWPEIRQAGMDLVRMIGDGIANLAAEAWNWGADIIGNFIGGIRAWAGRLWDEVKNVAQGVRNFLGFSEPEEGPLSNFHTYAPDMMKLFAKGIADNEHLVTDQLEKSFDFESTILPTVKNVGISNVNGVQSDGVIQIVVQSVLDGKVIGETAYKYQRGMARAMG